jgi:hypothetical protein
LEDIDDENVVEDVMAVVDEKHVELPMVKDI